MGVAGSENRANGDQHSGDRNGTPSLHDWLQNGGEWKKAWGAGSGRDGFPARRLGNRGYPRSEGVLEAAVQDRQPDLNERVGAAPAPTHLLLFGHASADEPVDPGFDHGRRDALTLAVTVDPWILRNRQ